MEIDETGWGENIWDASSWKSDITNKEELIKTYLDELSFPECQRQVVDFVETYFTGVFEKADGEEGAELEFVNSYTVSCFVDHFIFGILNDDSCTALQELQVLEIVCSWFCERSISALTYAVFDTLFGNMFDEVLQEEMKALKFDFLKKLASFSVGVKCSTLMDCLAIWIQKLGRDRTCCQLVSAVINDYCCLVPGSLQSLNDVVFFSPLLAYEVLATLPRLYSFSKDKDEDGQFDNTDGMLLPPENLIHVIGEWIVRNPHLLAMTFPDAFLEFPSIIENSLDEDKEPSESGDLLLGLLKLSFLMELHYHSDKNKSRYPQNEEQGQELKNSSSKCLTDLYQILYGILKFLSVQNKTQNKTVVSDDDDLEPGEVLDEEEVRPLISEERLLKFLKCIYDAFDTVKGHLRDKVKQDCSDKLAHVIQVGKASQTIGCNSEKVKAILRNYPKTRLMTLVLSKIGG